MQTSVALIGLCCLATVASLPLGAPIVRLASTTTCDLVQFNECLGAYFGCLSTLVNVAGELGMPWPQNVYEYAIRVFQFNAAHQAMAPFCRCSTI